MAAALVLAVLAAGCSATAPGSTLTSPSRTATPASPSASGTTTASAPPTYPVTEPTVWLCRPGLADNPCEGNLDTTVVAPDGTRTREPFRPAADPAFDCFYVYPTVSTAQTRNAPKTIAPEIVRVVRAQAALFQRVCRLYAPVYRQVTLRGLVTGGISDPAARALAQGDVVNAFHDYLNRDNAGRPFLLLGHSQGSTVLTSLVQTEIDGNPRLLAQLVSAMLVGGGVQLAAGSDTTGSFQNVPPCRTPAQAHCVVAYNTYPGAPPVTGLFGRTTNGRTVVCTNPAALGGGRAPLDPVVPVPSKPGAIDVVGFASFPGAVTGECRSNARATWLEATRVPGSQLPESALRLDRGPGWGLHRLDVTIALGDLVELAATQAATFPA